jgi:hypothetical protein
VADHSTCCCACFNTLSWSCSGAVSCMLVGFGPFMNVHSTQHRYASCPMCVYQGKKTRDDVRAAMFKTVFGNSAYRALISRHRRRHVGAGSPDSDSSASTDSDEGAAGAAHGVTGDERLFDDGSYEKTSACYSAGLSRGVCAAFKCVRVWLCMCVCTGRRRAAARESGSRLWFRIRLPCWCRGGRWRRSPVRSPGSFRKRRVYV